MTVSRKGAGVPPESPCSTGLQTPLVSRDVASSASAPLQLQLLGCAGVGAENGSSVSGSSGGGAGGGAGAARNTGLQDLALVCDGDLSDEELAAAAAALPNLRRLDVAEGVDFLRVVEALPGLSGMQTHVSCYLWMGSHM